MAENAIKGADWPRIDETSRAAVYGLTPKELLDQPLIVPPGRHVLIGGSKADARGIVRLQPKSIDDVKRWMGVSDELAAKRSCGCRLPSEVPGISSTSDYRGLSGSSRKALYNMAHQYVHGDSRPLAGYRDMLSHVLDRSYISGLFLRQDIDIYNRSVLELHSSLKVLFARHIRIWQGGLLKITGDVRIDCVSITGNVSGKIIHDFAKIENLGQLMKEEVIHG